MIYLVAVMAAVLLWMLVVHGKKVRECDQLRERLLCSFPEKFDSIAYLIHRTAVNKGFWAGENRNRPLKIALIHSEASELLEGVRKKNPDPDNELEELADIIIRCADYARGFRPESSLGQVIVNKMQKNMQRSHRHGKRF